MASCLHNLLFLLKSKLDINIKSSFLYKLLKTCGYFSWLFIILVIYFSLDPSRRLTWQLILIVYHGINLCFNAIKIINYTINHLSFFPWHCVIFPYDKDVFLTFWQATFYFYTFYWSLAFWLLALRTLTLFWFLTIFWPYFDHILTIFWLVYWDFSISYWTYGTSVFITTAAAAATVLFSQHFKQ